MSGTEYWIEKVPPTYLYLAIFAVQVLILLSFCCMIFIHRDTIAELLVLWSHEYGFSVNKEGASLLIGISSVISIIIIVVEIIRWIARIPCSKAGEGG